MIEKLINAAKKAAENSYSPYSGFTVGAALLTKDGKIYTGCNIENAAYSVSNCAERTALFKAVSEGERKFKAMAVVGGKGGDFADLCYPCGVCRQALSEFCGGDFMIITAKKNGEYKTTTLNELLPCSFGKENLS